jgi:hypothetical protein
MILHEEHFQVHELMLSVGNQCRVEEECPEGQDGDGVLVDGTWSGVVVFVGESCGMVTSEEISQGSSTIIGSDGLERGEP